MMRLEAVQRWPVAKNAPSSAHCTARSRSQSSSTTSGFLPPISSCTRALCDIAALATCAPVLWPPVNDTPATSGCSTSAPPIEPPPRIRLNTPLGKPASWMISVSACAVAGVSDAGFMTTVLPKASAGALFQAGIAIGKFQGVIRPNTPSGSR